MIFDDEPVDPIFSNGMTVDAAKQHLIEIVMGLYNRPVPWDKDRTVPPRFGDMVANGVGRRTRGVKVTSMFDMAIKELWDKVLFRAFVVQTMSYGGVIVWFNTDELGRAIGGANTERFADDELVEFCTRILAFVSTREGVKDASNPNPD